MEIFLIGFSLAWCSAVPLILGYLDRNGGLTITLIGIVMFLGGLALMWYGHATYYPFQETTP